MWFEQAGLTWLQGQMLVLLIVPMLVMKYHPLLHQMLCQEELTGGVVVHRTSHPLFDLVRCIGVQARTRVDKMML